MPRPGAHTHRDWPLVRGALAARGISLPSRARRIMARTHRAVDLGRATEVRFHFMRASPDEPESDAYQRSLTLIRERATLAIAALQAWRARGGRADLKQGMKDLTVALHAVRDSFSASHTQRAAGGGPLRRILDLASQSSAWHMFGYLWHARKDLAHELPSDAEERARVERADDAVRALAELVAESVVALPGERDGFDAGFLAFQRTHLAIARDAPGGPEAA